MRFRRKPFRVSPLRVMCCVAMTLAVFVPAFGESKMFSSSIEVHESIGLVAPSEPGVYRLGLLIGGGQSDALTTWYAGLFDRLVVVDNKDRIEQLKARFGNTLTNVIWYPVGEGQTAATLFMNADPATRRLIDDLAPMSADIGLGSIAGIGYQEFERNLQSLAHQRLTQFLANEAIICTNGSLVRVQIIVLISDCGGTGGAMPVKFTRSFVEELAIHGAPIFVHYDVLGWVTFAGLNNRINKNAAAALWRIIDALTRRKPSGCPLLVEGLRLIELPPYQNNQSSRAHDLKLDKQAWNASQLQAYLRLVKSNTAINGKFGNMMSIKIDRCHELNPQSDTVPTTARVHQIEIEAALAAAKPVASLVSRIEVRKQETPLVRNDTDALVENTKMSVEQTLVEIKRPSRVMQVSICAHLGDGREFDLSQVAVDFHGRPATLTKACEDLLTTGSIADALEAKQAAVKKPIQKLTGVISRIERRLSGILWRIRTGKTLTWYGMDQAEQLVARAKQGAKKLRSAADELLEPQEIHRATQVAKSEFQSEADYRRQQLDRVLTMLAKHTVGAHGKPPADRYVLVRGTNSVFPRLLDLPERSTEEQRQRLAEHVACVTLAGLGKMLGVEPRLETIEEALAHHEFPIQGPPPGAKVERREGTPIVILPPVEAAYHSVLPDRVRKLNSDQQIYVADNVSSGATCFRYSVYSAQTLRELMPGRMLIDLKRASEDPLRNLYFPDGAEGLEEDLRSASDHRQNEE